MQKTEYKMNKKLFIVVLNWNGWNYTKPCIESIRQEPFEDYTIILVDNGSDKEEIEKIKEYCDEHYLHKLFFTDKEALSKNTESNFGDFFNVRGKDKIIVIRNSDNLGFARGNNVALRFIANIDGQYAFLLNNDTIVSNSAIYKLFTFFLKHPEYVAVTPQIRLFEPNNRIWNCGGKITWYGARKYYYGYEDISKVPQTGYKEVDYVTGCALLLNLKKTGLLSDRFFFGEEDFELSLRLKKQKMRKACFFESIIYHKEGGTREKLTEEKIGLMTAHYSARLADLKDYQNPLVWNISIILHFISCCRVLKRNNLFNTRKIIRMWKIILENIKKNNFDKQFFFETIES